MSWTQPAFGSVAELINGRTGLAFLPGRRLDAEQKIRRAMERAGVADPRSYRERIDREPELFDDLIGELTIGETYFFREPGQFQFLAESILPELGRDRDPVRPLCAWSAACASGEEAYSLAMALDAAGLGPASLVVGTDISQRALILARRASYGGWSLRDEGVRWALPYLRVQDGRHVVVESIRSRVSFRRLNLAADPYPVHVNGGRGLDLIFCRNVLIYLDRPTIAGVARRLGEALAVGGWLITSSCDPSLVDLAPLRAIATDRGVFYRREPAPTRAHPRPPPIEPSLASGPTEAPRRQPLESPRGQAGPIEARTDPGPMLDEARNDLAHGRYREVVERTLDRLDDQEAAALHARALASLDPSEAERACVEAATRHPFSVDLPQLRAVLLLGLGRVDEAARSARRAIYLDRTLAVAHFVLGTALGRLGDAPGARRAFRNTRDLCEALPPDEAVRLAEGESAGRLAEAARAQLESLGADSGSEENP